MKKVYINTIGCQMNVYDSGRMLKQLVRLEYAAAPSIEDADLILVNTCAIREKAVHKLYSFLGRLYRLKKANKDLIIVVSGCVAQQQGENLIKRFPFVDIVMGTHAVHRLSGLLQSVTTHRQGIVDIEVSDDIHETEPFEAPCLPPQGNVTAFVTIMRGCDNYCTYCVVPFVRGHEVSRTPEAILSEIRALVRSGVKEVTLLGQNVNSYGMKQGLPSFPELLEEINRIAGLERLRFVTSHPKDLSDTLIRSFGVMDKLCNHIHLPVQSGSDRILKRMNRKYTTRMYIEKVEKLRAVSPEIAITTDMIVGFPGETGDDFRKTLDLMRTVRFDGVYAFAYSDRPDAPASHFSDKVDQAEKNKRLREVLDLQGMITREKNKSLIGRVFPILIEGCSKKQLMHLPSRSHAMPELTGRSPENRIVNFYRPSECGLDIEDLKGQIIGVRIDKGYANSLWGTATDRLFGYPEVKGGDYHVA